MMNYQSQPSNSIKKEGSVLLICTGSGRIIFVVGDPEIFELKHSKVLQRNVFTLGFTLRSLIEVRRSFPNGIMNFPLDPKIKIKMQYIRRSNIEENITDIDWRYVKEQFVKCLQLKCSTLKAYFSDQQIRHRHCQVLKIDAILPKQDESEEDLVLIQVQEMARADIKSTKDDYLYTRVRIQQNESSDVLMEEDQ